MSFRYVSILCAGLLTVVSNVPADVVWSGDMYQRAYHDIPSIDMNTDGITDFTFNLESWDSEVRHRYFINPTNGQVVVKQRLSGGTIPISLEEGTLVTSNLEPPDLVWQDTETPFFLYAEVQGIPSYGGLSNRAGYVGVLFETGSGSTHYGWIQTSHDLNRPDPDNEFLFIHGWAYESTPDTPIVAGAIPEPSTGILTMIGSLGLLQLARSRRRRKQGCAPIPRCHTLKASTASENW